MSTQPEKTGGEELTEMDYERAKELVRRFVDNQGEKKYLEIFSGAVLFLAEMFKGYGNVPVGLLEYADEVAVEKVEKRWNK